MIEMDYLRYSNGEAPRLGEGSARRQKTMSGQQVWALPAFGQTVGLLGDGKESGLALASGT